MENKPKIISNFLSTHITDPTFLTADFYVEPSSILFNQNDNYIEHGEITCYDINNSFITGTDGLVVTPMMLLKNLGETKRHSMFKNFTNGFINFINNEQWRLQSINGLDTVFTKEIDFKDGYTGSGTDKISITCLEDVNLSMYSLFTLYKECVYDYINKRQILPNNILQFEATINIYDVRDLVHYNDYNETGGNVSKNNTVTYTYNKTEADEREHFKKGTSFLKPAVCLRFSNCHFDLSSLSKSFENISIDGGFDTASAFTFDFTYGKVFISRTSSYTYQEKETYQNFGSTETGNNLYGKQHTKIEPENVSDTSASIGKRNMANRIEDALNSKRDQFGNEIQSKVNTLVNAPKKAIETNVYNAINKASAAISEGISTAEQQIEGKLSEAVNIFTNNVTETVTPFVKFNIYENLPSGPKK